MPPPSLLLPLTAGFEVTTPFGPGVLLGLRRAHRNGGDGCGGCGVSEGAASAAQGVGGVREADGSDESSDVSHGKTAATAAAASMADAPASASYLHWTSYDSQWSLQSHGGRRQTRRNRSEPLPS